MKQIALTQGQFALVDDNDFERLNQWKWAFNGKYAVRSVWNGSSYKTIYLHRLILPDKDRWVDHINHNGIDNQRTNLRYCNRSQNNMNSYKPSRISFSNFKGITRNRNGNWRARIYYNNKRLTIGTFKAERWAAMAYDIWAKELFGKFAQTNFPIANLNLELD